MNTIRQLNGPFKLKFTALMNHRITYATPHHHHYFLKQFFILTSGSYGACSRRRPHHFHLTLAMCNALRDD